MNDYRKETLCIELLIASHIIRKKFNKFALTIANRQINFDPLATAYY